MPGGGEASRVVAAPPSALLPAPPSNEPPNPSYFLMGRNLDGSLLSPPVAGPGAGPPGRGRAAHLGSGNAESERAALRLRAGRGARVGLEVVASPLCSVCSWSGGR